MRWRGGARRGDSGIAVYVGAPGTGKSSLALRHGVAWCRATKRPLLVFDPAGAWNFLGIELAKTDGAALAALGRGGAVRVSFRISQERDRFERLLRCVVAEGRVGVLVDEAAPVLGAWGRTTAELLESMREHRHRRIGLFLTTQHFSGDVSQAALSCAPSLFVFRVPPGRALRVLESEHGFDSGSVSRLVPGAFLARRAGGFPDSR